VECRPPKLEAERIAERLAGDPSLKREVAEWLDRRAAVIYEGDWALESDEKKTEAPRAGAAENATAGASAMKSFQSAQVPASALMPPQVAESDEAASSPAPASPGSSPKLPSPPGAPSPSKSPAQGPGDREKVLKSLGAELAKDLDEERDEFIARLGSEATQIKK